MKRFTVLLVCGLMLATAFSVQSRPRRGGHHEPYHQGYQQGGFTGTAQQSGQCYGRHCYGQQGFTGPAETPVTVNSPIPVSQAAVLPHDSFVILNGNIVNAQAQRNSYTFRDASGEITVNIGPKEWRGLAIGESDNVVIYGEVKNSRGFVHVKAHAVMLM